MMQLPSECWIKLFLKANLLENWFDFLRTDVAMKIWVAFAIMVIFYHKANKIKCCIYFNPRWNDLTCEKPGESSDKFGLSFVSNWLTGWNEFFFYQSHSIVKHCLKLKLKSLNAIPFKRTDDSFCEFCYFVFPMVEEYLKHYANYHSSIICRLLWKMLRSLWGVFPS